ncbi:MAG: cadmium-translocating P-type ATPase [Treponema sp.]|jgi:Cd2+/Zn2+-exporting ATPase|nr:cadmium-translocating P-type ATPase [Treponema sp.]
METVLKREYTLDGLCCPVCAQKIEKDIGKLEGISAVAVNFISKTLTIEFEKQERITPFPGEALSIIQGYDTGIVINEKSRKQTLKKDKPETGLKPGFRPSPLQAGIALGVLVFAAALALNFPAPIPLVLFLLSYFLIGGEVLWRALKNILKGQIFDENFLMSLATIGAFAIGEYPEAVAVMLFYQIGEAFQDYAVGRSRASITALMDIRPESANLKTGDTIRTVSPEEVAVGDLIVVKPGEKIPLDGTIVEGVSSLDTSALTGEALPRDVESGSEALSGSINKNGLLVIRVTKPFGESTVSKILDLVQNAGSKKSVTEKFITKFSRYYTPAVVCAALALALLPPLIIPGAQFSAWIYRALVFLVVSCPCALVISVPLSFFGGIGAASRQGILVKGSNYLDALGKVDTVVFDKTGTLSKGIFKVTKIESNPPFTEDDILMYAAYAESISNHPIALSIQNAYGKAADPLRITDAEELAGQGMRVRFDGSTILAGNDRLMAREGIAAVPRKTQAAGTAVYVAVDGVLAGSIVISDEIKPDSRAAIRGIKELGVKTVAMLSGDSLAAAEAVGKDAGVDQVYAELLPQDKVRLLEKIGGAGGGKIVFVGDGINDAPSLARSDIGVAMGGVGSDAAIEAADVVLMTDEPSKLVQAMEIARKTRSIVIQNIVFALGVKALILTLGALGKAGIWEAIFGDVGVALIAILNAMRAMGVKRSS